MLNKENFEETQVQERVYRQFGPALATRIIGVAEKMQSSHPKWSYQRCVNRATEWVFTMLTRDELDQMK